MGEETQDPTGEYQRHQRKIRATRKGTFLSGVTNVTLSILGVLLCLAALGYFLWTHVTTWLSYGMIGCLLVYCGFMASLGWQRIQVGRQTVTSQEVQQAKQQHRQALQEATQGKLPDTYSKSTRNLYLGFALFFGVLASVCWYLYLTFHTGDVLGYAIGHSIATGFALLGFLASLTGKAHQRASAAELRSILQAGEFSTSSDENPQGRGE